MPPSHRIGRGDHLSVVAAGGLFGPERVIPLLARRKIPFCVLPSGTANNLAKSLSQTDSLPRLVRELEDFEIHQLDVGKICSAAEERLFVEAVGFGPFVSLMRRLDEPVVRTVLEETESSEDKLRQGYQQLQASAANQEPIWCELTVDGETIAGRFVVGEVMNVGLVGPNVALVPSVDSADDRFDLVLVREEKQHELTHHLANLALGVVSEPAFEWRRCRFRSFHQTTCFACRRRDPGSARLVDSDNYPTRSARIHPHS